MSIVSILSAFAAALFLAQRLADPRSRWRIVDVPNERSLHTVPTPRTGGLAILGGVAIGTLLALAEFSIAGMVWIVVAVVAVALVSFWDDRYGVDVMMRLFVHLGATLLVLTAGLAVDALQWPGVAYDLPPWLGVPLTILLLLWMINLYNFMDGMDGLAGGMTLFGFGFLAVLGLFAHAILFATCAGIVAAASLGFLVFNVAPARIFMGDVGSATLGFLAGVFSVAGTQRGLFPLWVALLIFSPFIVDATVTLLRRLMRGEAVWQAHRTHYYQRLVQMGWGHRKTARYAYALMLACGTSALIANALPPIGQWSVLAGWVAIYIAIARWIDARALISPP